MALKTLNLTKTFLFALALAGLLLIAWQPAASFYLPVSEAGSQSDQSYLRNFYPAESIPATPTRFRWASNNATLLLPPLSSKSQLTLLLSTLPRPNEPLGQVIVKANDKEIARFELQAGWKEYSFTLDRKLSGPGYLELELEAPIFQVKGDARLFMLGFQWARLETSEGLQLPPLDSFALVWLIGMLFYLSSLIQLVRSRLLFRLLAYLPAALLVAVVAFERGELARAWFVVFLLAVSVVGISFVLRPASKAQVAAPDRTLEYLALVLLLAAFVRLYSLDSAPRGILPDEAVLGYDAYSLLKTGHDHHGDGWPLYFRSFNDFPPGVSTYLALPSVAVFGLSLWSIRLPFALLGIVTTLFSCLLATELFRAKGKQVAWRIGLLAGLFVAVSPWAVSQSRIALPVASLSFFFLGGFWLILLARRLSEEGQKVWRAWVGSGLLLGTAVWTYPTMKVFMALFLGGVIVIYGSFFWHKRREFAVWAASLGLVCLPAAIITLSSWSVINVRYSWLSTWANTDFAGGLGLTLGNYAVHYDPLRLFFKLTGDYVVAISSRPALIGLVLPALALPALLGLVASFSRVWRKQSSIKLLWLWLVIFPVGSALTREDVPGEIRSMSGVGLFEILAAFGCWWVWGWLNAQQKSAGRLRLSYLAATIFGLAFGVAAFAYLHFMLATDPEHPHNYFRYGYDEALVQAETRLQPGGKVCVEYTSQAYMLTLFYTRYDPATYQAFARQNDPPKDVSYRIDQFDKYKFDCDVSQELRPGDVGIVRFKDGGLRSVWKNFYPDLSPAWTVVVK